MILAVLAVLVFLQRVFHQVEVTRETLHDVIYMIDDGGQGAYLAAGLTYINSSGGTQQEDFNGMDHHLLGHFEIEVQRVSGSPVYISAQLKDEFQDTVHVAIFVDGKLLQEASSEGTYSIATASGSVQ